MVVGHARVLCSTHSVDLAHSAPTTCCGGFCPWPFGCVFPPCALQTLAAQLLPPLPPSPTAEEFALGKSPTTREAQAISDQIFAAFVANDVDKVELVSGGVCCEGGWGGGGGAGEAVRRRLGT